MNNENNQSGMDLNIIDDVTRIMQVKDYWRSQDQTLSVNRPKSRINNDHDIQNNSFALENFRLPLVIKKQNTIERNKIFSINQRTQKLQVIQSRVHKQKQPTRISRILNQSQQVNQTEQTIDYPLPSHNNTKSENLQILDSLSNHIHLFQRKQLRTTKIIPAIEIKQEIEVIDDQTFLTNNIDNKLQINLSSVARPQKKSKNQSSTEELISNQANKIISRRQVKFAGINFPYDLYMITHSRQKIIGHMMNNLSQQWGDDSREIFDELVKPDKEKMGIISLLSLIIQVAQEEYQKKKNELTSRNYLDNAYYGQKALRGKSQHSVSKILRSTLPQDSRFYEI